MSAVTSPRVFAQGEELTLEIWGCSPFLGSKHIAMPEVVPDLPTWSPCPAGVYVVLEFLAY